NAITLANPRMIKNEREVIPNPMGIFSVDDSALCVYVEIYNLSYDSSKNNMFKANYKIYRSDGSLEFDYGDILKQNPDSSSVISNKLSIAGWQPGRYDLKLVVTDLSSNTNAMASKRIIIFPKSGYLRDAVKFAKTSQLDTAGVKTISNVLQFLMSFQESATYNSLNDTGKVRFARQFFKDHDPSPATETNEFLDDLFRRYEFANAHFSLSAHLRDGWQSDRGRVLMQYGFWGERHEITAPITSCGVEYWTYSSLPNSAMKIGVAQKDIIFIFDDGGGHALLDKAGCYGLYQLVHSNAPGEIYNSEWDERIKLPNLGIY
ncbi:MAG: GWxTD domain-containing protein, partial [candidate division Zixibacteria bacterium]|nr:GWxTD domain-containing protein [candidate division Zixibacteria bacterium]